jgi:predicted ATP-dependent serine protease
VGEIGLGGEIRRVSRLDVRVAEAARLGFKRLLVPDVCFQELAKRGKGAGRPSDTECELVPIEEIAQAIDWLHRFGRPSS